MTKQIDFAPYTEAEIVGVGEDGSIMCNLRGEVDGVEYHDTNISFPADSEILGLTEAERAEIQNEI
ncbi:hypothetical protein FACS1894159_11900 [Bacteroidia bacterium]|nr:hypothetical protein FACS1894159_11900 [Bacteroidia bacterium]